MKKFILTVATLASFSSPALADKILQPGEMIKQGGERIYCAGGTVQPSTVYICRCGWSDQIYGQVTVTVSSGENLKEKALQLCKDETAQNPTQEMIMQVKGCRKI